MLYNSCIRQYGVLFGEQLLGYTPKGIPNFPFERSSSWELFGSGGEEMWLLFAQKKHSMGWDGIFTYMNGSLILDILGKCMVNKVNVW